MLPPVLFGAGFLVLWESFVRIQGIKPYLLPRPTAVIDEFGSNLGLIFGAVRVTGFNAALGLIGGVVVGLAVAFGGHRFRLLGKLISPLAAVVAAMPIIVLVAIFNNLFSITSQIPRRLMVLVAVFFIVFVNVSKGLDQSNPTQLELLRSYGAGPSAILRKVKLPNALGVPVHRASPGGAGGGGHRVRVRVLRRSPERSRYPNRPIDLELQAGGGLGLRVGRVPARPCVLSGCARRRARCDALAGEAQPALISTTQTSEGQS